MDIIKKINTLRLERNMSVYRISELSGISQSTLANTFSRGIQPSIENLEKICNCLGLTLSQFFCENEQQVYLTSNEVKMLENYHKLPESVKEAIEEIINCVIKEYRQ